MLRDLLLELGKVTRDHRDVEARKDRLLRLAREQERETPLHEMRGLFTWAEAPQVRPRDGDLVLRLGFSLRHPDGQDDLLNIVP
jgi:hypothetical protein